MRAVDLYNALERDFTLCLRRDSWRIENAHITPQFHTRGMGLVTDFTQEVGYVYTAVFPSQAVTDKILADGRREALLFVHHPMRWDITGPAAFTAIPPGTLDALRERGVSMYNLHIPLDNNGPYGTTFNLAEALGIAITGEFFEYSGAKVGIIGQTDCRTIAELKARLEIAVGHEAVLYRYGGGTIKGHTVALIAGGENIAEVYRDLRKRGVNTYVTGIASMRGGYPPSVKAHRAARRRGVSILAGSHYSTEKFACMRMTEYFARLGIPAEFVPDAYGPDDM